MDHSRTNSLLFRKTNSKTGRNKIISPDNSSLEALVYTRILLNNKNSSVLFSNGDHETALICMKGEGTVEIGAHKFQIKPFDTIFVPTGKSGVISTNNNLDIVECSAPSEVTGDPVFIPFDQLKEDPVLTQNLGSAGCERKIHRLIDDNVPAQRLLVGLIFSKPGNWTSWTPHEHAKSKEEIYYYFDMPAPAFGIQLLYEDLNNPDFLGAVYEEDAVVIKKGYHPNVAIPGHPINFVWMMATNHPSMNRSWADVNTQPQFL